MPCAVFCAQRVRVSAAYCFALSRSPTSSAPRASHDSPTRYPPSSPYWALCTSRMDSALRRSPAASLLRIAATGDGAGEGDGDGAVAAAGADDAAGAGDGARAGAVAGRGGCARARTAPWRVVMARTTRTAPLTAWRRITIVIRLRCVILSGHSGAGHRDRGASSSGVDHALK